MKKAALVRDYLERAIPRLKGNAQALRVFVDEGGVSAIGAPGRAWEYGFKLNLIFEDMPVDDLDAVTGALLAWIELHQPSLLLNPDARRRALAFEADFTGAHAMDLSVTLDLTEGVKLVAAAGGKFEAVHLDEPRPEPVYGQLEEVFANGAQIINHRPAHEPNP